MSNVRSFPRLALTASQAAQHLGVSISTVRRWSDSGALPSFRTPGGQRRFNTEQLDAFIAELQRGDAARAHG
jgi:excisionase family DNA binding protein